MNKKLLVLACSVALLLALVGCATTSKPNSDGSPYWTTSTPKSTRTLHYDVGSAKQSNFQLSMMRAESAAKDSIGRWASTTVDNALVTFVEEAGELLGDQQTLEVLQNLSLQTVNIALRGVSVVERYTAPDGTVWVLSSYPVKNLKDAYQQQTEALERKHEMAKATANLMVAYLESQLEKDVIEP